MGESRLMKKYTLEELEIGMKVYKNQLNKIKDTYIILTDVINTEQGLYGTIAFVGEDIPNDVKKLRDRGTPMTCVYNLSEEYEEIG